MHLWSNLLASILLVLSGANYPLSILSRWVNVISQMIPLTRGVQLTKDILNDGDYSQMVFLLGQEFLLGSVFFAISILIIRHTEYLSRVKGTMDLD